MQHKDICTCVGELLAQKPSSPIAGRKKIKAGRGVPAFPELPSRHVGVGSGRVPPTCRTRRTLESSWHIKSSNAKWPSLWLSAEGDGLQLSPCSPPCAHKKPGAEQEAPSPCGEGEGFAIALQQCWQQRKSKTSTSLVQFGKEGEEKWDKEAERAPGSSWTQDMLP